MAFVLVTGLAAAAEETRMALVMGNAAYKLGPLKNPINDARAMSAALKALHFEVIEVENAGRKRMQQARPFRRCRLAPRPFQGGARGLDGAVDVGLSGHRRTRQRLTRRRLRQLADLAGGRLDELTVDEEPELALSCDGHGPQDTGFQPSFSGQTRQVEEIAQVEAARIPDRDRLLEELRDAGLEAKPVDEVGIEVHAGDDELLAEVEGMITSLGAPFVPMKHDGVIYVRPPLS